MNIPIRSTASPRRNPDRGGKGFLYVASSRVRRFRQTRASQPLGRGRAGGHPRRPGGDRPRLSRHFRAAAGRRPAGGDARLFRAALLRPAHHSTHVRRAGLLADLYLHLCDPGGQEPALGDGADPPARHSPVGADPRLPVVHGDVLPRALSRQRARRRMRGGVRDLHQPSPGTWRSRSTSRCAPCPRTSTRSARGFRFTGWQKFWQLEAPYAVPNLIWKHDDVDVGRLVLRRRVGGDHRRRYDHHAAGRRLVHRQGQRRRRLEKRSAWRC